MSETDTKKITIDLTERADVPKIAGNQFKNFIQQDAFHRFRTILKTLVADAKAKGSQHTQGILRDRSHNAIAISGGRGSGKTTFILNALNLLTEKIPNAPKSQAKPDGEEAEKTFQHVKVLDVIDPTLIEHKEHILITILSRIKVVVDEHHKGEQRRGDNNEKRYERVIDSLKKVGEGLPTLKEIGGKGLNDEAWDNPQYVLQEGLKRARSGSGLEEALQDFITEALEYIGCKVFILPLDDIDTNFESGWPVLEVLRKYLTSHNIIVVLSGDFTLYSLLVRDRQWKLLENLDRIEGGARWESRHNELSHQVNRLEAQYLQKIIKPGNRIELLPLSSFWESRASREEFGINFNSNNSVVSLQIAMGYLTHRSLYSSRQDDIHRLAMLILRQPTRTVIHLLRALDTAELVASNDPIEPPGLREFHETLAETFLTELQSVGLIADQINLIPTEIFLREVHTFLGRNDFWDEGYSLEPTFHDDAASLASLCLGARLGREMRTSPSLIFEYFIKVCGTHDIKIGLKNQTINALMSFLALDRHEQSGITASRMIAAIRSLGNKVDRRSSLKGTVAVYYERRNRRRDKASKTVGILEHFGVNDTDHIFDTLKKINEYVAGYLDKSYESVIPSKIKPNQQVGFLFNTWKRLESQLKVSSSSPGPFFLRLVSIELIDQYGQKSSFLSVLPLIGCLAPLLNREDPAELLDAMGSTLRPYIAPSWSISGEDTEDSEDEHEPELERAQEFKPVGLIELLKTWSDKATVDLQKIAPLPPFVLARVWQRFQVTLARIDDDVRVADRYVGWLLHRQIIAFLNALLVEETRHRVGSSEMTLANPVTTDRYFQRNLSRRGTPPEPSIFNVIFSCPLWGIYLRPDEKKDESGKGETHVPVYETYLSAATGNKEKPQVADTTNEEEAQKGKEISLREAFKVKYETRIGKEQIHEFPNMYNVLNSLLVMGRERRSRSEKNENQDRPGATNDTGESGSDDASP